MPVRRSRNHEYPPAAKTDFIDICQAIMEGTLHRLRVEFAEKATVCKYIVPEAYGLPDNNADVASLPGKIEIGHLEGARLYYSSVDKRADGLYMTSSRAIGVVGIADRLEDAEIIAEKATVAIKGAVSHRSDIGTRALIEKGYGTCRNCALFANSIGVRRNYDAIE